MIKTKKPHSPSTPLEKLAEEYLDFWQENLSSWATDPDALEKWIGELTDKKAK